MISRTILATLLAMAFLATSVMGQGTSENQLSTACQEAFDDLSANSNFQLANATYMEENADCIARQSGRNDCEVGGKEYKGACKSAGGQLCLMTFKEQNKKGFKQKIDDTIDLCLPKACDNDLDLEFIANIWDNKLCQIPGANCATEIDCSPGLSAGIIVLIIFLVLGAIMTIVFAYWWYRKKIVPKYDPSLQNSHDGHGYSLQSDL
eukprot:TRINITY_DN127_c1_g1_i1.p2 TRINITY_DN127_c1_g1~~TRINITY_DN127_c1_g1_i1.p2  ORF type:complete len:207 (+),score=48.24 TRINITY_DN127_c1_g1_i1:195-815(+)